MKNVKIEKSWLDILEPEFNAPYMDEIKTFLTREIGKKKIIYPHGQQIFSAFNLTPYPKVKVVIIGQDPYHGPGQAHGLSFSVPPGVRVPPSLINIYKELNYDLNIPPAKHGCLIPWAKQGVLMINSVLTVEKGKAASHQGVGWEQFTDRVVEVLNEKKEGLVFVLWGSPAQKKGARVDTQKHLVIKSVHPSPLSASRGFFQGRYFSKINSYLESKGEKPIDWRLPSVEGILEEFKEFQELII